MGDKTGISWTNATWNPIRGCSRVSDGCRNCYAERVAARFNGPGQPYVGLAKLVTVDKGKSTEHTEARWTGKVRFVEEHLKDPIRWKRPRMIFTNSMSDLFHEKMPQGWIDQIFAVMALSPQHIFQCLTKRPERMRSYFTEESAKRTTRIALDLGASLSRSVGPLDRNKFIHWPLPNVWLGISVENQKTFDERYPLLAETTAAIRWLSYEPALGPVDFGWPPPEPMPDWVVYGGESGVGYRQDNPEWARSMLQQCRLVEIPFFYKQSAGLRPGMGVELDGKIYHEYPGKP